MLHAKALLIGGGVLIAFTGVLYATFKLIPMPVLVGAWCITTAYCAGRFILKMRRSA